MEKENKIIEKDLSYALGGNFFEVQDELGRHCLERQYGDLLEKKLIEKDLNFKREFPLEIADRKSSFVDFIVKDKILIDLKAKTFLTSEDYHQMQKYLEISGKELGLIVNFRDRYLKPRRVLNPKFVDSDKFVGSGRNTGFVLLFTILVSSIIFLIALGISGISYRETILTSEANGGAEAFFAADTGAECGLYLAIGNGILCLGATKTINDSGTSLDFPLFSNIDDKYCVAITQSGHSIESRGYNVDCNEVQSGNPRAVQRAIEVTYKYLNHNFNKYLNHNF